jgi:hypothetical protein
MTDHHDFHFISPHEEHRRVAIAGGPKAAPSQHDYIGTFHFRSEPTSSPPMSV